MEIHTQKFYINLIFLFSVAAKLVIFFFKLNTDLKLDFKLKQNVFERVFDGTGFFHH